MFSVGTTVWLVFCYNDPAHKKWTVHLSQNFGEVWTENDGKNSYNSQIKRIIIDIAHTIYTSLWTLKNNEKIIFECSSVFLRAPADGREHSVKFSRRI